MALKELFYEVGPFCFVEWAVLSGTTTQFALRAVLFILTVPLFPLTTALWVAALTARHFTSQEKS